jgi:tetratricopeptide (TPR) repeat protein
LERHGHYNIARVVLGRVYQDMGKASEAEAEFKKVLDADPGTSRPGARGRDLPFPQATSTAIEEFQKALALNPDDEPTQELLKKAIETAAQEQSKRSLPPPPREAGGRPHDPRER